VSRYALGTLGFGAQDNAGGAYAQLDLALDAGIDLIDTAELYPSPPAAATYGAAERLIGAWLAARGGAAAHMRVATKVAGPAAFVPWIRGGRSRHDATNLTRAVDGSLARLGRERIDLLQLHWPDRASNFFGQLGFKPARQEAPFDLADTARALSDLIASGKVAAFGVANETAWGLSEFLRLAQHAGCARPTTIQNPYSLLNRSFEVGLAEVAWRGGIGLLAYGVLGNGALTGKYLGTGTMTRGRLDNQAHYRRFLAAPARAATARYCAIARDAGLDPAHLALAFVASKPWVASVIIGARDTAQLAHNLQAQDVRLSREVVRAIDAVHEEISNPCP